MYIQCLVNLHDLEILQRFRYKSKHDAEFQE
jgi:hypothetical protein